MWFIAIRSSVIAHFMHGVSCLMIFDLLRWNIIITYVVPYVPFCAQFEVHVLTMCSIVLSFFYVRLSHVNKDYLLTYLLT